MTMRKIRTILFLFVSVFFVQNSFAQKDTLFISDLRITPDATVAGIQGVSVIFSIDFVFDTTLHKTDFLPGINAQVRVLSDKMPVKAVYSTRQYIIDYKYVGCDMYPKGNYKEFISLHIPYYSMDLSSGLHTLSFAFSAEIKYSREEKVQAVIVGEDLNQEVDVNIPEKEYFKVLVSYAAAYETDFDGRGWDYFLNSRLAPDLKWKVVAFGDDRNDYFYESEKVKSSYVAKWTTYSSKICVSKGDVLHILVVDNDKSFDDLVADIPLSIEKLFEISEKNEAFETGRLSSVKISAQRLAE
ncbi:MAG: hypothetical protein C0592_09900 [Marinilabiliales bacterium]|nr:MAG: hypothetical protein C0592_09900 [Marinilabiliales bacterium]